MTDHLHNRFDKPVDEQFDRFHDEPERDAFDNLLGSAMQGEPVPPTLHTRIQRSIHQRSLRRRLFVASAIAAGLVLVVGLTWLVLNPLATRTQEPVRTADNNSTNSSTNNESAITTQLASASDYIRFPGQSNIITVAPPTKDPTVHVMFVYPISNDQSPSPLDEREQPALDTPSERNTS